MSTYNVSFIDPIQPYLLQISDKYYRNQVYERGIQEFFCFRTCAKEQADENGYLTFRMVPDVEMQILLPCSRSELSCVILEPDAEELFVKLKADTEYFGIRFMPGLVGQTEKFLQSCIDTGELQQALCQEEDFLKRCRIFKTVFEKSLDHNEKHNLNSQVPSIYAMVSKTNGDIRIDEMSRSLGYSQRYMSKMIKADFGMSPKTFCKYMKFQKSLEYLGCRNDMDITEVSNALGYYDQSHFVKYFKEFTGITPKKYVSMVRQGRLYQKIETVGKWESGYGHRDFTCSEWRNLFLAE